MSDDANAFEFHVVAEGFEGTYEYPSGLDLCALDGAVFICWTDLLAGDRSLGRDPRIADAPHGHGIRLTGEFPDDTWALGPTRDERQGPESDPTAALYRLESSAWREVARFPPGAENRHWDFEITRWTPGRVLVMDSPRVDRYENEGPLRFHAFGPGSGPVPSPRSRNGRRIVRSPSSLRAFEDGAVVLVGQQANGADVIEVWRATQQSSELIEPPPRCHAFLAEVFAPDEILLLGRKDDIPCAIHLQNGVWVDVELPRMQATGKGVPAAYAREPLGTQWLVLTEGGLGGGSTTHEEHLGELWRRVRGDRWKRVRLAPPQFATRTPPPPLQALDVHVAADGDVWLLAHYFDKFDRGVILRTRRHDEVCWLEHNARPRCRPRAKH